MNSLDVLLRNSIDNQSKWIIFKFSSPIFIQCFWGSLKANYQFLSDEVIFDYTDNKAHICTVTVKFSELKNPP